MKFIDTGFEGLYIIENDFLEDNRGGFKKIYNVDIFKKSGIDFSIEEQFFTFSKKDVIRAMHFQLPPFEHIKLISVLKGNILDVVLDLRKNSKTYLKYKDFSLSEKNNKSLLIPIGFAHGYKCIENNTIVSYITNKVFNQNYDNGIKYDSFGFDWGLNSPIISDKDKNLINLNKFNSPF